jgi:hydroxylamine reductase
VFIREADKLRAQAKRLYEDTAAQKGKTAEASQWPSVAAPATSDTELGALVAAGKQTGLPARFEAAHDDEAMSLAEMAMYGLKGLAAYAHHAAQLGYTSERTFEFVHRALAELANPHPATDKMLGLCMAVGEANVGVMGLLDQAHTTYARCFIVSAVHLF